MANQALDSENKSKVCATLSGLDSFYVRVSIYTKARSFLRLCLDQTWGSTNKNNMLTWLTYLKLQCNLTQLHLCLGV